MAFALDITVDLASNCKSFTVADDTGSYNATSNPEGYDTGAADPNVDIADVTTAVINVTKHGTSTTYTINAYPTLPSATVGTTYTVNNTDLGLTATDTIPDGVYLIEYVIGGNYPLASTSAVNNTITIAGDWTGVFTSGYQFTVSSGPTTIQATYTTISSALSLGNTVITVSSVGATTVGQGAMDWEVRAAQYEFFFCNGTACLNNILQQIDVEDCVDCMNTKIDLAAKVKTFILAGQYAAACGKPNKATVIMNYLTELCALTECDNCGD